MTVSYALLGLLEEADRHGYDLKQSYDRRFGASRPLRFGQVYRTLAQLERDGLIMIAGVEAGAGPERKRYSITAEGATDLERWIYEPEDPQPQMQTIMFTKALSETGSSPKRGRPSRVPRTPAQPSEPSSTPTRPASSSKAPRGRATGRSGRSS